MSELTLSAIIIAGFLSFLSPCVLPLVPAYMCYLTGSTIENLKSQKRSTQTFLRASFFVMGFSTIFVILGASATYLGLFLRQYTTLLSYIAGGFITLMGLHFLGVLRINFLNKTIKTKTPKKITGNSTAYAMGLAFGFGWTPCIGPVLGAILAIAASQNSALQGAVMLALYALGLGIPFLLFALAINPFATFLEKHRAIMHMVEKITGILLIIAGIGFLFGLHTLMANWLLEIMPDIVSYT